VLARQVSVEERGKEKGLPPEQRFLCILGKAAVRKSGALQRACRQPCLSKRRLRYCSIFSSRVGRDYEKRRCNRVERKEEQKTAYPLDELNRGEKKVTSPQIQAERLYRAGEGVG